MLSLIQLPPRLRDKIRVESSTGCWIWLGAWTKPRTLLIDPIRAPESNMTRVDPKAAWVRAERGVGRVQDPSVGYSVDAHRSVYAAIHGCSLQAVPRLQRCSCEKCVNPNHAVELPSHRPRRATSKRPQGQIERAFKTWKDPDILAILKSVRPYPGMGPEACADEAGCPVPSPAVFQQYRVWDAENPD